MDVSLAKWLSFNREQVTLSNYQHSWLSQRCLSDANFLISEVAFLSDFGAEMHFDYLLKIIWLIWLYFKKLQITISILLISKKSKEIITTKQNVNEVY